MEFPKLTSAQIEQIAQVLGNTERGFTGSELGRLLTECNMRDPSPGMTKWKRLFNAFCDEVNKSGSTNTVYQFVQHCLEPARGLSDPERYSWMRVEINRVLMFVGIEIRDDGNYFRVPQAETLREVQRRTKELRDRLTGYGAHGEVLKCCKEELLAQDYFHAVQEAAKSLCERVREISGLTTDGTELINTAFAIRNPYIAFNALRTASERNQQNGLKEMLLGVVHMVRNVTAHELRVRWDVNEEDAVDILNQISYLHKLLDICVKVPKP